MFFHKLYTYTLLMYNDQKKLIRAQKIQERVKNDVSLSLYFVDHIFYYLCIV